MAKFQPGQSGNPNGRPKRKLIDEALIEALESDDCRVSRQIANRLLSSAKQGSFKAIKLIMERTQGRPLEKVEMTGADGERLFEMSEHELDIRIAELTQELGLTPSMEIRFVSAKDGKPLVSESEDQSK